MFNTLKNAWKIPDLRKKLLFTLLIMLPSVFLGHPRTMLTVTMKVTCSVLLLLLANLAAKCMVKLTKLVWNSIFRRKERSV